MTPYLSIIICSRNRSQSLARTLKALNTDEIYTVHGEVILVDNGSSDDTLEKMEEFRANSALRVIIVHEDSVGLSFARNAGLQASSGSVIIFTDDDCYLSQGYVARAKDIFSSSLFQYCGGNIYLYDQTDSEYFIYNQPEFEIIPPYSYIPAGKFQGTNLIIDRKVCNRIGFFDTNIGAGTRFRFGDIDYVARASLAGFAGAHIPDLVVYHHHGRKSGPELNKLKVINDFARGAYFAKYISLGYDIYLRKWITSRYRPTDWGLFIRELRGAIAYLKEFKFTNKKIDGENIPPKEESGNREKLI